MKLLIKDGNIVDGTGREAFRGSILIEDGKIVKVYEGIDPLFSIRADEVYEAGGLTVTPGFIDTHRHGDTAALTDPDFGIIELRQGITTVLNGNCGLAPTPMSVENREALLSYIEPCLGHMPDEYFFPTLSSYLDALEEKPLRINTATLAATGAITVAAKGFTSEPFTSEQLEKAKGLVRDAMEAGAFGLSCGIMYDPECYTLEDEYVAMVAEAAPYGGYLTSHVRGEGNSLIPSVEEVIRIAGKAGVPINISHFKVVGIRNWGKSLPTAIEKIEAARAAGVDVTTDAYPYMAGSTTILTLVPPTVPVATINTPEGIELLKKEIARDHDDWDNMVHSIGWDRIIISSVIYPDHKFCSGKNMQEIAEIMGVCPEAALTELVEKNGGKVGVILMSMSESDVELVLGLPYTSVISDSLYGGGDLPHPRLYGAFPRMIADIVRNKKLMPLEEAVHKMTGLPAKRMGLTDRGLLKEGMAADICVFDPETIQDTATFTEPKQYATGLNLVLVGGEKAVIDDTVTGAFAGKVLRKGR